MRYINPCLREAGGRYYEWQQVVVRYKPLGVKRRYNPDDFAWVDVTDEFSEMRKTREQDDSNNKETGRLASRV